MTYHMHYFREALFTFVPFWFFNFFFVSFEMMANLVGLPQGRIFAF
jgi:hypothetical protein